LANDVVPLENDVVEVYWNLHCNSGSDRNLQEFEWNDFFSCSTWINWVL